MIYILVALVLLVAIQCYRCLYLKRALDVERFLVKPAAKRLIKTQRQNINELEAARRSLLYPPEFGVSPDTGLIVKLPEPPDKE